MNEIVNCEECGKRYSIDFDRVEGKTVRFKCRGCNHVNTIVRATPNIEEKHEGGDVAPQYSGTDDGIKIKKEPRKAEPKIKGIGIRTKMTILFIILPVLLMAVASLFYVKQMQKLSNLITDDSTKMVSSMAEDIIIQKARGVAREVRLFLDTHPGLTKEDFNTNQEFRDISIQKVGKTGYTCIVEKPNPSEPISKLWSHPLDKLIGVDINEAMKKTLGNNYQRWYEITVNAFKDMGQEAAGYYMWYDKREKYMAMVPVEKTNFFVSSTTYLDEFTVPIKELKERADSMTAHTMSIVLIILAAAAILVALIAYLFGNSLSGRIRSLTDVADRISVGDLDAEIPVKSTDEIGALGEAIGRMQDSISISIERLRRRGH